MQQQLATALAARRAASLTAEHSAATLKQLEHRLGELSVEKNVGSGVDACFLYGQLSLSTTWVCPPQGIVPCFITEMCGMSTMRCSAPSCCAMLDSMRVRSCLPCDHSCPCC